MPRRPDPLRATRATRRSPAAKLVRQRGLDLSAAVEETLLTRCSATDEAEDRACELLSLLDGLVSEEGEVAFAPGALSTEALLEHIVERHHDHVWSRAPFLAQMAAELAALQLDTTRDLFSIAQLLKTLERTLTEHLRREEGLYRDMLHDAVSPRLLSRSLVQVERDHEYIGALVERLRRRTRGYRAPAGASNAHRGLFRELDRLDAQLRSQVLLEDHVLRRRLRDGG